MTLEGVLAPVPTPFDDRDRVDLAKLRTVFGRWVASPLRGFVVLGSNGEAGLIDEEESDLVVGAARELVPRGRSFIVGTGRESTQATVRATKRAAGLGADAVLVRAPSFFKSQMSADAFVRHYRTVADLSPVPVLLYNFAALTGVNLTPEVVSRLAGHPNIIGIKESGSDPAQIAAFVKETPPSFVVLSGSSTTFLAALSAGVAGGMLALSAVIPEPLVRLYTLARQGRREEAKALQEQLVPLARLVGQVYGVPGLKAAMTLAGHDVGGPRPPLLPVSEEGRQALREALAKFQEVAA
jgi:dihydrodipicolinate synthase/N-acetylneuraminate lyase